MRDWVIDSGNHRVKIAGFSNGRMTDLHLFPLEALAELYHFVNLIEGAKVIISSVSIDEGTLKAKFRKGVDVHILGASTRLPFSLPYKQPATLGKDRVAAVTGAIRQYPGLDLLVVDAGSCMTIDFVRGDAQWLGGNISPGLAMRTRAMHELTGRLPHVVAGRPAETLWGQSTEEALRNGAIHGMLAEISYYELLFSEMKRELRVIVTGGDAMLLAELSKTKIFVAPNLVLTGLHEILQHIY